MSFDDELSGWFGRVYRMSLALNCPAEALPKLKVKPGASAGDFIFVAQIAGFAQEGMSPFKAMHALEADLRASIIGLLRDHEADVSRLKESIA